jgi:superfamily II DNA or RNA helicase
MTAHYLQEGKQAGIVVVPTGGGKTVLAAHWLLEHHIRSGGRVLWLAHRRSLLRQAMSTFHNLGNVAYPKPALHLATVSSTDAKWTTISTDHDVVFSSMQTGVLDTNLGFVEAFVKEAPSGTFVVVDEAHHAPAPSYARLLRSLKSWDCKLLGLTATPVRANDEDAKRLAALFDIERPHNRPLYQVTRRQLTKQGILAHPAFTTVKTEVNLEKDFTPEDYRHLERYGEMGPNVLHRLAKNAHRNKLIVDEHKRGKAKYGPTIMFAADTLHAQTLAHELQKAGIDADYVDYSREDAQAIMESYRTRHKPDVLVNVEMLTEGFDAPHTRTVFIARPTRSPGLVSQMVGRALRGRRSGGNEIAHLVTFRDTWEQFDVLDTEYVLREAEDSEKLPEVTTPSQLVVIPPELVTEAYRILQSNVRGHLVGVFQCLPHSWYAWIEVLEDDLQPRHVMVFDNQIAGFEALLAAFPTSEGIPEEITEDFARALVQRFFVDVPDPLPRWADVAALLHARRSDFGITHYTFEEKSAFDPSALARQILERKLARLEEHAFLQGVWDANQACRSVYRDDLRSFLEDVSAEMLELTAPPPAKLAPEIERIVPQSAPRPWGKGEQGYSLVGLRRSVLSIKKHFPGGPPPVSEMRWSERPTTRLWGFCRYSDRSITLNCVLDSPDIPYFVLEYLMFHEMLHADMPSAGHNRDYRERERGYTPSAEALEDAERRGIRPGANAGPTFWYVTADRFLGTFDRYYLHKAPGTTMEVG